MAEDRIGFIGIGAMGAPMVRRLVRAGRKPVVQDVNRGAAELIGAEAGLEIAESPSALARRCAVVILMLPDSGIVERVCLGEKGLAEGLSPGAVIVDMSSSDPVRTRDLGGALADRGVALLDAPVSGGVRKAADGSLAIMLGGDDAAAMARVTPVLEAMGRVRRTGSLGSGHATKALNNYVSAAGLAAACEAVIVGRAFGLDPATLIEVINVSTGRNNSTENKVVQFILSGEYKRAGFSLPLMAKDVGLAAALADRVGRPLPGLRAARRLWSDARDALGPEADHTEIFRFIEGDGRADDAG
ncbi:NAD(P)-dependent oxidoreductase [Rubrimonas sp.]|uniref:NAD(P)-dependent oxidoreductase n=1 Tax=Rubrimonas sp. TaxID=2036015 RepID=UPI002FDE7C05